MTNPEQTVRVRFAPSPTGFLHVGGARTAIYNALFRLRFGGAFVLRIEDTDRARSNAAMTRQIQDALGWLGVKWDEGPLMQSDNVAAHLKRAHELVEADLAYPCFLNSEELEKRRAEAKQRGTIQAKILEKLSRDVNDPGEVNHEEAELLLKENLTEFEYW